MPHFCTFVVPTCSECDEVALADSLSAPVVHHLIAVLYDIGWPDYQPVKQCTLIAVNCECKYFLGLKFCIIYNLFLYPE